MGRHCLSFRLRALSWGPRDLCSSSALPQTHCGTLGKWFNLCFLNFRMGMIPAPPSVLWPWLAGRGKEGFFSRHSPGLTPSSATYRLRDLGHVTKPHGA